MDNKNRIYPILTWIIRILTGSTFIISGFVKAVDPWGTLYKLEDYMDAMHLPQFPNLLLVGAFALCAYEFVVGVFLILGCFRRSTPIFAAVFMAVMLPLTFWIAVWNPVADCGCFGDAIILSNWATFWKNVVLTAAVVYLIKFNARERCLVRPSLQWLALLGSCGFVVAVAIGGYIYQPLIDFRPYPVGSRLIEDSAGSDEDVESESDEDLYFVYAKDGEEKRFSINDELPADDSGWEFIRRESATEGTLMTEDNAENASIGKVDSDDDKNLRIWSKDGEEDMTEDAIPREGREVILFMPDLKNVSIATTWQINSLSTWAAQNNIGMIGVVSATPEDIANWEDLSMASYPLYTADDTQIKMVVRGNPAVVYVENGKIMWKSTLRALDTKDFLSPEAPRNPALFARDNRAMLRNAGGIYIAFIAVLIILSLMPALVPLFGRSRKGTDANDGADKGSQS